MKVKDSWLLLWAFVGAELFKLWRSRVARAMAVAPAVVSPLLIGVVWLLLDDKGMTTFPRVQGLIYLPLGLLAGLSGLLLTIEVMGGEFGQGTVRTVMGRGTPRWLFVGGKAVGLLVFLAAGAAIGTLSGGAFAVISHLGQVGTTGLADGLGDFGLSWLPVVGIGTLAGLAYVGIVLLLVVLARSSALAVLAGLLVFAGDFAVGSNMPLGSDKLDLAAYSIVRSTFVLLASTAKHMGDMSLVISEGHQDAGRAFLTLALYAVVGVIVAYYVFKQQDLADKK